MNTDEEEDAFSLICVYPCSSVVSYPCRLRYDCCRFGSSLAANSERTIMLGRGFQTAAPTRRAGLFACRAVIAVLVAFAAFFSASCSRLSSGKTIETASAARPLAVQALTVAPKAVRRNIESVGSLFAYEEVAVSSEV